MTKKYFLKRSGVAMMMVACLVVVAMIVSCDKDDANGPLDGSQSPIGDVGNTFSLLSSVSGVSNISAQVVSLEDGVSSVAFSTTITNATYRKLISDAIAMGISSPNVQVSGTNTITVTGNLKFRITDKGIQSVYSDGSSATLVKYNAKVGDVYSLNNGTRTKRREVTKVSTQDEFSWNGMKIKTIHVKGTGNKLPGVDYFEYVYNHRFGLVACKVFYEDGSSIDLLVRSNATN